MNLQKKKIKQIPKRERGHNANIIKLLSCSAAVAKHYALFIHPSPHLQLNIIKDLCAMLPLALKNHTQYLLCNHLSIHSTPPSKSHLLIMKYSCRLQNFIYGKLRSRIKQFWFCS